MLSRTKLDDVNLRPRPEVVITANEIRLDAPNIEPIWPICPESGAAPEFRLFTKITVP